MIFLLRFVALFSLYHCHSTIGELALRALVYIAESQPIFLLGIISQYQKNSLAHYPVCVGAINVVLMLCNVLGISDIRSISPQRYWDLFEDPKAFFVLFYASFRLLDRIWVHENGRLQEFSRIITKVESRVRYSLDSNSESLTSLCASL